jgi:hypothetical protein
MSILTFPSPETTFPYKAHPFLSRTNPSKGRCAFLIGAYSLFNLMNSAKPSGCIAMDPFKSKVLNRGQELLYLAGVLSDLIDSSWIRIDCDFDLICMISG